MLDLLQMADEIDVPLVCWQISVVHPVACLHLLRWRPDWSRLQPVALEKACLFVPQSGQHPALSMLTEKPCCLLSAAERFALLQIDVGSLVVESVLVNSDVRTSNHAAPEGRCWLIFSPCNESRVQCMIQSDYLVNGLITLDGEEARVGGSQEGAA